MAQRIYTGNDVYTQALMRLVSLFEDERNYISVSFSGGKDSGVCLELAIEAARMCNRLPVDVVMRDEEIMLPGTFEYAERVAQRPEVEFHWLVANHPIINVYNRREPYFWTFDPRLQPHQWVRQPPSYAKPMGHINIERMVVPSRFPRYQEGQQLMTIIGLRTQESRARAYGLFSSKGFITKPNRMGVRNVRPIYDWSDGDVWLAHKEQGWDYNRAYDTLYRLGLNRKSLRIAPVTLNYHGHQILQLAARGWPRWFDRVATRLPGVRAVVHFGMRACLPARRTGETWEECFKREVLDSGIPWLVERAEKVMKSMLRTHRYHSTTPFPEVRPCHSCINNLGCWKALTLAMYNGDPFGNKFPKMDPIEPSFFRPELAGTTGGTWGGAPTW